MYIKIKYDLKSSWRNRRKRIFFLYFHSNENIKKFVKNTLVHFSLSEMSSGFINAKYR